MLHFRSEEDDQQDEEDKSYKERHMLLFFFACDFLGLLFVRCIMCRHVFYSRIAHLHSTLWSIMNLCKHIAPMQKSVRHKVSTFIVCFVWIWVADVVHFFLPVSLSSFRLFYCSEGKSTDRVIENTLAGWRTFYEHVNRIPELSEVLVPWSKFRELRRNQLIQARDDETPDTPSFSTYSDIIKRDDDDNLMPRQVEQKQDEVIA